MQVQRRILVLVTLAAALVPAGSASAGIWTQQASGTTDTITAVDYQGEGRLWYATSSGRILKNGVQVQAPTGVPLNDLQMSPDGTKGLAVGDAGKVYRSADGGASWTALAALSSRNSNCGSSAPTVTPLNESLVAVSWADNATAYLVGLEDAGDSASPIQKTVNGGTSFTEVNRRADNTCPIKDELTDVQALPNTSSVYFIAKSFGDIYFSADGLAGSAAHKDEGVNCFDKRPRLGLDTANPNRLFAIDQCPGSLQLEFSEDAGSTFNTLKYPNSDGNPPGFFDVAVGGGTAIAVGNAGSIFSTLDGRSAYSQPADGGQATTDWRAVDVADATHAVVAGAGGNLAVTTSANFVPDLIPPAGTITGPTTAVAGTPTTYTAAVADNAGGSGIDANGFAWTATGVPAATGNPVAITFPSSGFYTVKVTFKDLAGNTAEATLSVNVSPAAAPPATTTPKPVKTTTASVPGASIKFGVPSGCVQPGSTFTVTLKWSKQKKKGNRFVKVTRTDFYIGSKRVRIDKKAPFVATLKVTAGTKAGSKVSLRARAYIKVKKGKAPKKSIKTSISVCG